MQRNIPLKYKITRLILAPLAWELSPARRPNEQLSSHRIRYTRFLSFLSLGLAIGLAAWFSARPTVAGAIFPFAVMFLYIGLPMALAASCIAMFGFLFGALWALYLERTPSARVSWPKIRILFVGIFLAPFSMFALYWFVRGLLTMETLALKRYGNLLLITSTDDPVFFWLSILGWAIGGFSTIWLIIGTVRRAFSPDSAMKWDAEDSSRPLP